MRQWPPARAAIFTLIVGLAVSAALTFHQRHRNQAEAVAQFEARAHRSVELVQSRMRRYENALRGARGAVVALGLAHLDRKAFADYSATRDLATEFPGVHGVGFVRRVSEAQAPAFVAAAAADGWPGFAIRQLQPRHGERYVVQYLEPLAPNRGAIGLDLASDVRRRDVAQTSLRTGAATLSAPIMLVQDSVRQARSFLLMLPVFGAGTPQGTLAEREANCLGWTVAPLVIGEVLDGVDAGPADYSLTLWDEAEGPERAFFGGSTADAGGRPEATTWFPVLGRSWGARFVATPTFLRDLGQTASGSLFGVGLLISALLAALVHQLVQARLRSSFARAAQVRRAAIVAGCSDAIIGESLDGFITDWNRAAELLLGFPSSAVVGRLASSVLLPEGRASEDAGLRAAIARGECVRPFDTTRLRSDGVLLEVSVSASPIAGPDGRCVGLSKTVRDVTETRRAQRALADLNATLEQQVAERTARLDAAFRDLRSILDAQPSLIAYWDKELGNEVANEACARFFGTTPEALRGRAMREVIGDAIFELDLPHLLAALRGEKQTFERTIEGPDGGGRRHTLVHYLPDLQNGMVRGFYSVVHDVTELVDGRLKLLETSNLLRAVLSSASEVSIIATDAAGLISIFNRGAQRLLGYDEAEMVGRRSPAVVHLADEVAARGLELTAQYGEPIEGFEVFIHKPCLDGVEVRDWTYVRRDGVHVPVQLTVTAMRDGAGKTIGYLGVAHDISRQIDQERSLRAAAEEARRANLAKSQFLANMSHEIRTPMSAVIGLSYLLERTSLDPSQASYLAKIKLASKSLLSIINDVLDLSKIEAAEFTLERAPFSPASLLRDLSELVTVQAEAKGVDFTIEQTGELPASLEGDATRLHQILVNLLSNAIKFTERGGVRLRVQRVPAASEHAVARLRFVASDSGIGIEPQALGRLFSPFVQADASTTRRFGGTGLGLSIVKQLVGLMGGEVGVTSTPGVGSDFWVELEFAVCAEGKPAAPLPPAYDGAQDLSGVRILVADDSPVNLVVARRVLQLRGAEVAVVTNGQQAVDHLVSHPGTIDLVLMDMQMPVLDGKGATRQIRSGLGLATLPIIALTAGTTRSERLEAEAAGVNDFVTKPFDPPVLAACILRNLARSAPAAALALPGRAHPAGSWPQIAGIDSGEVRVRLGGDEALFRSLLERMLLMAADLDAARATGGPPAQTRLAELLHELKGTAATLGAGGIAHTAAAAEDAGRAGRRDEVHRRSESLALQLAALKREVDALPAPPAAPVAAEVRPLEAGELAGLLTLLRASDLSAVERFASLAPRLSPLLGPQPLLALRGAVDGLRFEEALALLAPLPLPSAG